MVSVRSMALVFWARRFSLASTCFSNTFLEVLLPAFVYDKYGAPPLTNARRGNYGTRIQAGKPPGGAQGVEWERITRHAIP